MKTIFLKTAVIAASVLIISACAKEDGFRPCVRGNNDIDTESRSLPVFTEVDYLLEGPVEVRKGNEQRVQIEGNSNQLQYVKSKVENGKLRIYSDRCLKNTDFHFIVYTSELEGLKLSGSGSAYISDEFSPEELSLEVAGSGKVSIATVEAGKVQARISGSGDIEIGGECDEFDAQLSGSGKVFAFGLVTAKAGVQISGSGGVEIFVTGILNANISGSGLVRYKGSPVTVNSNISGSGKVVKVQ